MQRTLGMGSALLSFASEAQYAECDACKGKGHPPAPASRFESCSACNGRGRDHSKRLDDGLTPTEFSLTLLKPYTLHRVLVSIEGNPECGLLLGYRFDEEAWCDLAPGISFAIVQREGGLTFDPPVECTKFAIRVVCLDRGCMRYASAALVVEER